MTHYESTDNIYYRTPALLEQSHKHALLVNAYNSCNIVTNSK